MFVLLVFRTEFVQIWREVSNVLAMKVLLYRPLEILVLILMSAQRYPILVAMVLVSILLVLTVADVFMVFK